MDNHSKDFSLTFLASSFLLFVGFLFDDVSSLILFFKGYWILESNPIAVHFSWLIFMISNFVFYVFILTAQWWTIRMYKKFYKNKWFGYKLYDVFLFLFCLVIVTITITKVELGFNNYELLSNPERLTELKEYYTDLGQTHPEIYKQEMRDSYKLKIVGGISYIQFILSAILAYIIFRLDHKVSRWNQQ